MDTIVGLNALLGRGKIENELDFERASIISRKLRVLVKEHPELTEKRIKLRGILREYENRVWAGDDISAEKIAESDLAETVAEGEHRFLHKRRILIREKLQSLSLSQKDLAKLLGHRSVTHMSELVSGITPFTTRDLVIIHLLLKIDFNDLVPTSINPTEKQKITLAVQQLNNPKLKINEQSLELIAE
jgi:hypothetical protein